MPACDEEQSLSLRVLQLDQKKRKKKKKRNGKGKVRTNVIQSYCKESVPGHCRKYHKKYTTRLAQSKSVLSASGARVGVNVVRLLVRLQAVRVTGLAGSSGAAVIIGLHGEARLNELRGRVQVDGRQIPVKGAAVKGVLELQDAVLVLGGGELDGDATTVGVGLPGLLAGATVGVDGLHGAGGGGSVPDVDGCVHVVDDLEATAGGGAGTGTCAGGSAGGIAAGHVGSGHGSGSDSKDAGDKDVGEKHFEKIQKSDWFLKRSGVERPNNSDCKVIDLTKRRVVCSTEKRM